MGGFNRVKAKYVKVVELKPGDPMPEESQIETFLNLHIKLPPQKTLKVKSTKTPITIVGDYNVDEVKNRTGKITIHNSNSKDTKITNWSGTTEIDNCNIEHLSLSAPAGSITVKNSTIKKLKTKTDSGLTILENLNFLPGGEFEAETVSGLISIKDSNILKAETKAIRRPKIKVCKRQYYWQEIEK